MGPRKAYYAPNSYKDLLMPRRHNESMHDQLALAVASGRTIAAWSRETGTNLSTAYSWTSKPEFEAKVQEIRQELVDQTVGRLVAYAAGAVGSIAKLMATGESEAIRLSAAKAILAELVSIGSY